MTDHDNALPFRTVRDSPFGHSDKHLLRQFRLKGRPVAPPAGHRKGPRPEPCNGGKFLHDDRPGLFGRASGFGVRLRAPHAPPDHRPGLCLRRLGLLSHRRQPHPFADQSRPFCPRDLHRFFTSPRGWPRSRGPSPATPLGKPCRSTNSPPSLAFITTPLIVEALLSFCPWQTIVALIGGAALILGLAYHRFGLGGNFTGEAPTPGNIKLLAAKPTFWIMAIFFGLAITASVGIYSMIAPLPRGRAGVRQGHGQHARRAFAGFPVIAVALGSGWLADRFGPKPMIAAALIANGLTTILLGALPGRWVILMVIFAADPDGRFLCRRLHDPLADRPGPDPESLRGHDDAHRLPHGGAVWSPIVLGSFGDAGAFRRRLCRHRLCHTPVHPPPGPPGSEQTGRGIGFRFG